MTILIPVLILGILIFAQASLRRAKRREPMKRPGGPDLGFGQVPFELSDLLGEDVLRDLGGSSVSWSSASYTWDPVKGQWVQTSSSASPQMPAPLPDHSTSAKRHTAGPLGGLFGSLDGTGDFQIEAPAGLPTFADVGGMEELKTEIRDTIGLVLAHPADAERYGIEWNGILLHGPSGVGKTFFARAIAGEYRLNLLHVSTGDLVSSLYGGSSRNVDKAFQVALQHLPCVLFFDEFDSIAQRRDDTAEQESRRTVNQLLTSLEAHREERRLFVMAATNSIEHLDPAAIRPGRFDRHVRVDLPDAGAREAIFLTELDDRPMAPDVEVLELVRRTEGMTPAAIERIVDAAALAAFRDAATSGEKVQVTAELLLGAIEQHGGQDRPTVEHWRWDALVLPPDVKEQLQQLQAVIEDPDRARAFGVEPPSGLLLVGPPGTGKTTIAKVLAAQARCSFYPVSGADVMSKWVGESERGIRRLFERARENRPSIVFIDEIDAIAGRRGEEGVLESQVNQLLAEIDGIAGQRGVFVIGATNRPDRLDPALVRGGRLSRTIALGLPDEVARLALLRMFAARMPTVDVRLEEIAAASAGMSPADLKAVCQEAALAAMSRSGDGSDGGAAVHQEDFEEALGRLGLRA